MPKRMVDTELWNDEEIIETFTAEDRYFWLYLLTNPHNDICGVLKNSPALMSRDMGYHKDCIVNLIYRFECVHKLIYVDKETKEILILNWYKHNWTKSPKILSLIEKELAKIKSKRICDMIRDRMSIICGGDTVSIPYPHPPNTNTIPNTNSNSTNSTIKRAYANQEYNISNYKLNEDDKDLPDWYRK